MPIANAVNAQTAGIQSLTSAGVWNGRTITAGPGISVSNGDGVSGNPTILATGALSAPGAINLGISYSAGTFTVKGATATLSATNPAYITIPSAATPGNLVTIAVTADQTFTDGSAGTTDNQRFGLTTGVNASLDMPFFLYAVVNDTDTAINFMINRMPHYYVTPAAANIGKTGSVVNNGQRDFFSLGNVTVGDYDSNPCICVGSFRMTFTGATDSWTVQTLAEGQDGIGKFQEGVLFGVPRGQFGATANKYFLNNGGTAFDDADGGYTYSISKDGRVLSQIAFPSMDTAGAGAVNAILAYPFLVADGGNSLSGFIKTGAGYFVIVADQNPGSSQTLNTVYNNAGGANLKNADMGLGAAYSAFMVYNAQK